jgi:soluble lytic murein transglycosylase
MRGHALVLLIAVALLAAAIPADQAGVDSRGEPAPSDVQPATVVAVAPVVAAATAADPATVVDPASSTDSTADAVLEPGRQLLRRGDYVQAEQFYANLASQEPMLAPRALLLQARATLANGDTDGAEALIQQLLGDYPDSDQTADAYFTLEQIRRATGNCAGALRALDAYLAASARDPIGPYAALQRAQCAAKLGQWTTELSAANAALAIDGGGPRLTQIEALERAAEADLQLGRQQDALNYYNRSLALAGTPAYTAEMLFTTATIARAIGQTSLAADRFRAIVVDYADQARGPGALDALIEMGRAETVSPLEAGKVRFDGKQYMTAIAELELVDPTSPDWGAAQLQRAEAELKLDDEADARSSLQALVDAGAPEAGSALLRLGQLDERGGNEARAEAEYQQMATAAPDRAPEALFHVGFTRFIRGDRQGALAAWQTAIASGPRAPDLQAQLQYWVGRALPEGSSEAQAAFNYAAAASPESYNGLRAQDQLDGSLSTASVPTSAAWLMASPQELQERADWFAALNLTPDRVTEDVLQLPSMRRAETLLDLGLSTEASWEIDGVVARYAATRDVAHISAVADWTTAHDLPQLTLRIGKLMRDLVGLNGLPRSMQKQVYPAGWGDIVAQQAETYSVDPLLLLALMRQESAFDPHAVSGARAMGLTQIVPATARGIAAKLGANDFTLQDLYKPETSVGFGAYFLSELIGQYRGQVFPTLAAYDAGGGNVTSWIKRFTNDPDLLVEQVPFAETQMYLRIVYDNYWHYRHLWRAG